MSMGSAITLAVERIIDPVEGMHQAIAGKWFSAVGPPGRPVRAVHDKTTHAVYQSVRVGAAAVGGLLDVAVKPKPALTERVQAYANGLWGDRLGRHRPRLGISMSARDRSGDQIDIGPELADAYPAATGHIVLLVHGLVDTERCWHGAANQSGLLDAIEKHRRLTPVLVRYNSGQEVALNGQLLAELVEDLHGNWPVPVDSISLVGHSMGGLVIRSACASAHKQGQRWIDDTTDVVALGSPHLGTPLEKFVAATAAGLGIAPETRPLAEFLDRRSLGIKNLRFGDVGESAGLPPGIDHHFVAGVVTTDPDHPIGRAMGDLIVRPGSATGARRLSPTSTHVAGNARHSALPHRPDVVIRVMGWIEP